MFERAMHEADKRTRLDPLARSRRGGVAKRSRLDCKQAVDLISRDSDLTADQGIIIPEPRQLTLRVVIPDNGERLHGFSSERR